MLTYWIISGLVGVIILAHYDRKHEVTLTPDWVSQLKIGCFGGGIVLVVALFIIVKEELK